MCLFLNNLVFRVNKKKKSVDKLVDTPALEPRGFEPCQRCKRKKTYTHTHAHTRERTCTRIYIYLCLHIIIIIIDHCWRGFQRQHRCQHFARILFTFVQLIENERVICQQNEKP